ncbi:MAG: hypothetical protein FWG43_01535, partial [Clostridiales bacterium]|nr:hypothetical protein [Clostridiales bacterium]
MKKRNCALLVYSLSIAVLFSIISPGFVAWAIDVDVKGDIQNAINDSETNTITVNGSETGAKAMLVLDIPLGVVVDWNAEFSGTVNKAGDYLLKLTGDGTFNLNSKIENKGTCGAISVSGVTLNINSGGTVSSPSSGIAIFNDSKPTHININGGTVIAGNSSAIQANSTGSIVAVAEGLVTNAATSNINPTINMTAGEDENIIVWGGEIKTTNTAVTSYVLQTTGKVKLTGGQVSAIAGRAINLVGEYSQAIISGGIVSAVSGIAISTATTDPSKVTNAKIIISGGWVYTETGTSAIQVTGVNNEVMVSGGFVTATTGCAIKALSTATHAEIGIDGGFVFAYGTKPANVVAPDNAVTIKGGTLAAWNSAIINPAYIEGDKS